ncbi:MAG TPA: PIN domain-containing protein [Candidatus Deferrimicrobiaceae bacterium]|nr:PIN domain-containing protein [Candidatus Deferrimicrobiaceae bacterium]
MRLLLDTTFGIDFLRYDPAALRRFERAFEDGDEPYVNEVVVCELAVGVEDDDPGLAAFLRAVAFVQPPPSAALRAGTWRRAAHRQGRRLSLSDALIAAAAESIEAPVVTRNAGDFALTPVRVETY